MFKMNTASARLWRFRGTVSLPSSRPLRSVSPIAAPFTLALCRLSSSSPARRPLRYVPAFLEGVENLEHYVEGGYHPCTIGEEFSNRRYQIVHKLGYGGSSTVWLARDSLSSTPNGKGSLVTLKVKDAVSSSRPFGEIPELAVPQRLREALPSSSRRSGQFNFVLDHFLETGPNGRHLCVVTPFHGPSIQALEEHIAVRYHTRLRGDISRRMGKEVALALQSMHSAGFVHGDLTTSNILLSLTSRATQWTDDEALALLGEPERQTVVTQWNDSLIERAPREVVGPASIDNLASHLSLSTVISDFGQSYNADEGMPSHISPATVNHYAPPEMRFASQVDFPSDIWMLACALYEIRAGHSLFDSFLGSESFVIMEMVSALGKLPDAWWSKFESRHQWFDDSGEPRSIEDQERDGVLLKCEKESLRQMVNSIGRNEEAPEWCAGWRTITEAREPLSSKEAALLTDLLEKTLRYDPAERLTIGQVLDHPWFDYEE